MFFTRPMTQSLESIAQAILALAQVYIKYWPDFFTLINIKIYLTHRFSSISWLQEAAFVKYGEI